MFLTNSFIIAAKVLGVVVLLHGLSTILSAFLMCRPFASQWDSTIEGHCGNMILSYWFTGVINVVTDVSILILPIPHIYKLQLELYKRLALIAIFSVGVL